MFIRLSNQTCCKRKVWTAGSTGKRMQTVFRHFGAGDSRITTSKNLDVAPVLWHSFDNPRNHFNGTTSGNPAVPSNSRMARYNLLPPDFKKLQLDFTLSSDIDLPSVRVRS